MGAHVARRSRFPTAGYHRCHGNAIKDPLNLYRGTGVIGVSVDPSDYQNYDIVLARMEFAGAEIFEFFLSPIHLPNSPTLRIPPFVGTFSDNSYVVLSIVEICTSSNFHSPGRNNSAEGKGGCIGYDDGLFSPSLFSEWRSSREHFERILSIFNALIEGIALYRFLRTSFGIHHSYPI